MSMARTEMDFLKAFNSLEGDLICKVANKDREALKHIAHMFYYRGQMDAIKEQADFRERMEEL